MAKITVEHNPDKAKLSSEKHTPSLIILVLMPASRFLFGEKKAGYIKTTLEAGFNGIAGIIGGGGSPKRMKGRLKGEKRLNGIYPK